MSIRTALLILLAASIISGCGRRGSLEAPGADVGPVGVPAETTILDPPSPGAVEPQVVKPAAAPERRFILDPLI